MTIEERFWSKVNLQGPTPPHQPSLGQCWIWMRAKNDHGYGMFSVGKKMERAHRSSWILNHGPIPEGFDVLHKCDNRPCVRPGHLFLGTDSENHKDMVSKGRHSHGIKHRAAMAKTAHLKHPALGEKNGLSKLTSLEVDAIRSYYDAGGHTHRSLASIFGVSHATIGSIIRKEWWKNTVNQL